MKRSHETDLSAAERVQNRQLWTTKELAYHEVGQKQFPNFCYDGFIVNTLHRAYAYYFLNMCKINAVDQSHKWLCSRLVNF